MLESRNVLGYDLVMKKSLIKKNTLGLRSKVNPLYIHLGVLGGGIALGYITFPYRENPLGATLLGAASSVAAVALLLLAYDAFREKRVSVPV